MTCAAVQAGEIAEKYLVGALSEQESAAFEAHYFGCEECLSHLEVLESLRNQLRTPPLAAAGTRRSRWIWPAAAAAAFLCGLLAWRVAVAPAGSPPPSTKAVVPSSPANEEVTLLAELSPPPYRRSVTRGVPGFDPRFEKAMEHYTAGDYAAAASALSPLRPAVEASFYLAIARMQLGQPEEAANAFTEVIARGDTLFLEQARLYRAKANLRLKRKPDALNDLRAAIALHGDREEEAREFMRRLEALPEAER